MQEQKISSYTFYSQYYSEQELIIVYPKDYEKPAMYRNSKGEWFKNPIYQGFIHLSHHNSKPIASEETKALEEEFSEIIKQQITDLNNKQPLCLHLDKEIVNKITRKEDNKWVDIFFGYPLDENYKKIVEERLLELKGILIESEIQNVSFLGEELRIRFSEPFGYVTTKDFEEWKIKSKKFEGKLSAEFSNLIKDRIAPESMIELFMGRISELQTLYKEQQNSIKTLKSQMNDLVDWVNKSPFLD